MAKQAIRLNTKQLNQMIEEGVKNYLNENSMEELRAFDNWKERTKAGFNNFRDRVSSGAKAFGQGVKGTVNGGLDQGRQMYNQSMADSSREIADRNQRISNSASQSSYAKNSDIPEDNKTFISIKYKIFVNLFSSNESIINPVIIGIIVLLITSIIENINDNTIFFFIIPPFDFHIIFYILYFSYFLHVYQLLIHP